MPSCKTFYGSITLFLLPAVIRERCGQNYAVSKDSPKGERQWGNPSTIPPRAI